MIKSITFWLLGEHEIEQTINFDGGSVVLFDTTKRGFCSEIMESLYTVTKAIKNGTVAGKHNPLHIKIVYEVWGGCKAFYLCTNSDNEVVKESLYSYTLQGGGGEENPLYIIENGALLYLYNVPPEETREAEKWWEAQPRRNIFLPTLFAYEGMQLCELLAFRVFQYFRCAVSIGRGKSLYTWPPIPDTEGVKKVVITENDPEMGDFSPFFEHLDS